MDASRARAKLPIVIGLRQSDAIYPLASALIDVDALRDAGGIPTAISGITQEAQARKLSAETKLRMSGFNTTAAAQCLQTFIDKPDPQGTANKALVVSKARALGADVRFASLWVADKTTDPGQLTEVARQLGCKDL